MTLVEATRPMSDLEFVEAKDADIGAKYKNRKGTTDVLVMEKGANTVTLLNLLTENEVTVPPTYKLQQIPGEVAPEIPPIEEGEVPPPSDEVEPEKPKAPTKKKSTRKSGTKKGKKPKAPSKDLSSNEALSQEILKLLGEHERLSQDALYDLLEGYFDTDGKRTLSKRLVVALNDLLLDGEVEDHEDGTVWTLDETASD